MIASLRGRASELGEGALLVDVGGVGYLVQATAAALRRARAASGELTLLVHTHVREDALQLFGFASADERRLFELLLGVRDVGAKLALAIVSAYEPDRLERAVAAGDLALFTSIRGVGRKTAERILLDLKDKVGASPAHAGVAPLPAGDDHAAAREALVGLGLSVPEAEHALRAVDRELPVAERVRAALQRGATRGVEREAG
jgi:Holliday junction DNA helicase RuvA